MKEKCKPSLLYRLSMKTVQVLMAVFLLINCLPAWAQSDIRVKGTIKSDVDGFPLIGVNVIQKGTTNGTISDIDGNYELTVPVGTQLEFSYVGYINHQITVTAGRNEYNVSLREDSQSIEEVVVMGYGVQKKKLVTGATVQVSGDDLQRLSVSSPIAAMQSQTPGVTIIQNSGQPGDDFKVFVRGQGTVGDAKPLYVVDGIAGVDVNNLNPSDIESIDVLKDAASAAIYGARAANGVILVTTRQGRSGKMQLSYDGYVGIQNIVKKPDILNGVDYMDSMDEMRKNEGIAGYDWANLLPEYLYNDLKSGKWKGTDWLKEVENENALTQNHSFNVIGGSDISKLSMGFSYSSQEGTIGKQVDPKFSRYTGRINSEAVILKIKDFDAIKIGENITFSHRMNRNSVGRNAVFDFIQTTPLLPNLDSDGGWYDQEDKVREGWTYQGGIYNPIALMALNSSGNNYRKNFHLNASAYVEIQPIKNLKLRSLFGYRRNSASYRAYRNAYNLSTTTNQSQDQITQEAAMGYNVSWENTLSYNFKLNQVHTIDAVIGQSIEKWGMGDELKLNARNGIFPGSFKHAYINNAKPVALNDLGYEGYPNTPGRLASFFGRINYNYKETYMASFVLRADGSSNFAKGNQWGYFPSVSAGWVMTNEPFMESTQNWLDFFKLRASWGQNGNSSIDGFQYLATIAMDDNNSYFLGDSKDARSTGAYPDILPNTDISWETSEQLDFGFDARFFNGRFGAAFDWYKKTTKDWLVRAPQLATFGTGAPYINGGDIKNQGIELGLNWNDNIGDFTYGINFNITYNKNEVTRIANTEGIIHGNANVLSSSTTEMYRAQVGYPIGYFWGYKTEGIYQNQAQIDQRRTSGQGVIEGAQPGDVIFTDSNGDGIITDDDKVEIGNPIPDITSGLTFTFGYKGFDLGITAYGNFGHQIAKSYRAFAISHDMNFTHDIYDHVWRGEGTSNKLPRLTTGSHSNWQYISDIYIHDADFVKISNVTIGYDFKKLLPQIPLSQARLYLAVQNLATITGYNGMDPEVGSTPTTQGWASGIDRGLYPSPRTWLVGVNLKF